ncbi:MAG: DNA repair protein RecN [Miniphocaeibacter sp.]|uniref:DNA repair protein RecN n=1 Tax=Miniphocaeibacter sp. TaxID=3100973 RepID=UPI003BB05498
MLAELYIENFIIIKKLNIEFSNRFNVITGETGSGKSILVNSLQLLLGGRFQKSFFGKYGNKSIVEGKFLVYDVDKLKEFQDAGYTLDDNELIITRELQLNGKTSNRINGRNISLALLKELMDGLMDIHSQNENQTLLKKENYLNLIDSFNPNIINDELKKIEKLLKEKDELLREIESLEISPQELDREKDILQYQLSELEELDLENIDEEEILSEYKLLSNIEEIINDLNSFSNLFSSEDYNSIDIFTMLGKSKELLGNVEEKDKYIKPYYEELNNIYFQLEDIVSEISRYTSNLYVDDEKLAILNSNIETITNLKRKYGASIEDLIVFRDNIYSRINRLNNIEENLENLKKQLEKNNKELNITASIITGERKKISEKLEEDILFNIKDLNMPNAKFRIEFSELENVVNSGKDKVDFLISTNIGQDVLPLIKIASGGELSRIMLGFKTALANVDNVETLIFDEIDAGISGRTAQLVGEKLIDISNYRQIIVISHLPQIASLADNHLLIDKEELDDNTISKIYSIKNEDRINEIARLIGGVNITNTTIKQAKEMIDQGMNLLLSKRSKK